MKKLAKELKKGDSIKIAGNVCKIETVEISDIGKQGTKKVRLLAKTEQGESITIIRPQDYPFDAP